MTDGRDAGSGPSAQALHDGMRRLSHILAVASEPALIRMRDQQWGAGTRITVDQLQSLRKLQLWLLHALQSDDPSHWEALEAALMIFEASDEQGVHQAAIRETSEFTLGGGLGIPLPERLDQPARGQVEWPASAGSARQAFEEIPASSLSGPSLADAPPGVPSLPTSTGPFRPPGRLTDPREDGEATTRMRRPPAPAGDLGTPSPHEQTRTPLVHVSPSHTLPFVEPDRRQAALHAASAVTGRFDIPPQSLQSATPFAGVPAARPSAPKGSSPGPVEALKRFAERLSSILRNS